LSPPCCKCLVQRISLEHDEPLSMFACNVNLCPYKLDDVLSVIPARTPELRPAAAGGAGGSDAIAHAIGHTEVRLGVNMVAVAVPGRVLPVPRGLTLLSAAEQTHDMEQAVEGSGGAEGMGANVEEDERELSVAEVEGKEAEAEGTPDVVLHLGGAVQVESG